MNILITSAGRRGYIIDYFKYALKDEGKVHVGNSTPFSAAFAHADQCVVTPLIYSEDYIPFLITYCKRNDIKMVISLFDIDLMVLSKNKKKFDKEGITIVVSSCAVIEKCNDKWAMYKFCLKEGISTPRTFINISEAKEEISIRNLQFPLIVKPRWGMGSLQIYWAETLQELEVLYEKCKKDITKTYLKYESKNDMDNCVLIQEAIMGQEYGVDVINDLQGRFCKAVVKKKYGLRAGETDCAEVVDDDLINKFAKKLGIRMGHVGNLDVDLFYTGEKIYLLEMNARIGGGFPFSYMAGVDLPLAIIKWVNNEKLKDELEIKTYHKIVHKDIQLVDITDYV